MSFPFAALILILVFASLVAAGMPLVVAALAIPTTLAGVYLAAQVTELSIYVQNVATMLGLALAIDYSLFMVSRFREELRRGRDVGDGGRDHGRDERQGRHVLGTRRRRRPVRAAAVRAGRAALVRHRRRADRGRVGVLRADVPAGGPRHARSARQLASAWPACATDPAGARPAGRASQPTSRASRAGSGWPTGSWPGRSPSSSRPSRSCWSSARRSCDSSRASPTPSILPAGHREPRGVGRPVERLPGRRDLADHRPRRRRRLADRRGQRPAHPRPAAPPSTPSTASTGSRGRSPASRDPATGAGRSTRPASPRSSRHRAISCRPSSPPGSSGSRRPTSAARRSGSTRSARCAPLQPGRDGGRAGGARRRGRRASTTQVGGLAADGHDFMTSQSETIPYAIALTLGASALILFLLFGSVVIPIKAVIMTLLSITASFGALVFIFQDGNFSRRPRVHRRPGSPWPATRSSCSASCSGCRWTTRSCCSRASRRPTAGPATTRRRWPRGWPRRPASSPARR